WNIKAGFTQEDRQRSLLDMQKFNGVFGVTGRVKRLSGKHSPLPKLKHVRSTRADQKLCTAPIWPLPEYWRIVGTDQADRNGFADIQYVRDGNSKRRGCFAEYGNAGISLAFFDFDQHALAYARAFRKLVQGQAILSPQGL